MSVDASAGFHLLRLITMLEKIMNEELVSLVEYNFASLCCHFIDKYVFDGAKICRDIISFSFPGDSVLAPHGNMASSCSNHCLVWSLY